MKIRKVQFVNKGNDHHDVFEDIYKLTRGGISFGYSSQGGISQDNIDGCWAVNIITPGANVEFAVPVTLGRIPIAYDVKRRSAAATVYDGTTPWTTTHIYLKCSITTVTLTLFIH